MHATIESNENSNYNKDSAVVATIKNEELVEKEEKKKEGSDKRQGRGADNNKDNSNDMTITMTLPQWQGQGWGPCCSNGDLLIK